MIVCVRPPYTQDLKPAVATLIYAANRADITELHEVRCMTWFNWIDMAQHTGTALNSPWITRRT